MLWTNIQTLPFESARFQFNDASIIIEGEEAVKPYVCLSIGTDKDGVTGELIDAGKGYKAFYEENDVKGKIVLIETKEDFEDGTTEGMFQMMEAQRYGAAAVVIYTNENIYDENTIRATYGIFKLEIPVVTVSYKDAKTLKNHAGEPVVFRAGQMKELFTQHITTISLEVFRIMFQLQALCLQLQRP